MACSGGGSKTNPDGNAADVGTAPDAATPDTAVPDAAPDANVQQSDAAKQAFKAVNPCTRESDYKTGSEVTFGDDFRYTPKCLKVAQLTAVQFSGDFTSHPLQPSGQRGDLIGSPIQRADTGTSRVFFFDTPGFFAYNCDFHGIDGDGSNMAGVVWVTSDGVP